MFNICRLGVKALIIVALLAGVIGCGGSSNNDQGSSFLALGYFQPDSSEGDSKEITGKVGDLGRVLVLGSTDLGMGGVFSSNTYIGLENRLKTQYIRVVRVDCRYTVPGASPSLVIPDSVYNLSGLLESVGVGDASSSSGVASSKGYYEFPILSHEIAQFLTVNKNLLPKDPFNLLVVCRATGVAEGGDALTTNDVPYQIEVVDEPDVR